MKIISPSWEFEGEVNKVDSIQILRNIERFGRTCYRSESNITEDSAKKFVKMLIDKGHESVLEHEKITVRVICDRGVSHEIVRHRIASYSQESTRYCNYGHEGEITVILPLWFIGAHERHASNAGHPDPDDLELQQYKCWRYACEVAERIYMELLKSGQTPQQARSVLPNSLKTEIVITFNLREWRHFFKLRTSQAAHPQMREITVPMLKEFQLIVPVVFEGLEASR